MTQMLKSATLALAAAATLGAALPVAAAPQFAAGQSAAIMNGSEAAWHHDDDHDRGERWNGRDNYRGSYEGNRSYYDEPVYASTRTWRGDDGRYYCRRSNGTTGLLIGGVVGGVIGHEVAGRRGDRTLGVILGAAGGALLGRAIDRNGSHCR